MTLYSIFDRDTQAPEAPAAIPERFSWLAVLLPPAFAVVHGLWLELIGFVVAVALLVAGSFWLGAEAGFWLYVLFAVWIGFEAPSLRRAALKRKGWTHRTELVAAAEDLAQVEWLKRPGAAQ